MLVAFPFAPALFGLTDGAGEPAGTIDRQRFRLVAPYDPVGAQWLMPATKWLNAYDGAEYRLYTSGQPPIDPPMVRGPDDRWRPAEHDPRPYVRAKSMRDVVNQYLRHAEPKRLGVDGEPCHAFTVGPLSPRPVTVDARLRRYIGKEAHRIEDALAGLIGERDAVCRGVRNPALDPVELFVRPIIAAMPVDTAAGIMGCNKKTIYLFVRGRRLSPELRERATCTAGAYVQLKREVLDRVRESYGTRTYREPTIEEIRSRAETMPPTEALALCEAAALSGDMGTYTTRHCAVCRNALTTRDPRATYCSEVCRLHARRRRNRRAQSKRSRRRRSTAQRVRGSRHD